MCLCSTIISRIYRRNDIFYSYSFGIRELFLHLCFKSTLTRFLLSYAANASYRINKPLHICRQQFTLAWHTHIIRARFLLSSYYESIAVKIKTIRVKIESRDHTAHWWGNKITRTFKIRENKSKSRWTIQSVEPASKTRTARVLPEAVTTEGMTEVVSEQCWAQVDYTATLNRDQDRSPAAL